MGKFNSNTVSIWDEDNKTDRRLIQELAEAVSKDIARLEKKINNLKRTVEEDVADFEGWCVSQISDLDDRISDLSVLVCDDYDEDDDFYDDCDDCDCCCENHGGCCCNEESECEDYAGEDDIGEYVKETYGYDSYTVSDDNGNAALVIPFDEDFVYPENSCLDNLLKKYSK